MIRNIKEELWVSKQSYPIVLKYLSGKRDGIAERVNKFEDASKTLLARQSQNRGFEEVIKVYSYSELDDAYEQGKRNAKKDVMRFIGYVIGSPTRMPTSVNSSSSISNSISKSVFSQVPKINNQ